MTLKPYKTAWLVLLLAGLAGIGATRASASEDKEPLLWPVPEDGSLVLAPLAGYSIGNQMDGPLVGMRAMFVFKYFMGGVNGQAIFVDSGAIYLFGLDLHGRFGPFYGGIGFAGHFLPGSTGSPTPSMNLQTGIHFPTFFPSAFVEVAYRVNIIFHAGRQEAYHALMLGLLFESGT